MDQILPKRKRRCDVVLQPPLPIPISSLSRDSTWHWYNGRLTMRDNDVVIITEKDERASNLLHMGFFGEERTRHNRSKRRVKARQREDYIEMKDIIPSIKDDAEVSSRSMTTTTTTLSSEDEIEETTIELEPCEAFFLSFALGCLVIKDERDRTLKIEDLWTIFRQRNPRFPDLYNVYHHFRRKGWVVKDGLKFGADFLLYKHGPPFYHSSFSVVVKRREMSWTELSGLNRVTESAGKDLLLAEVIRTDKDVMETHPYPYLTSSYVRESLLKRWVPMQEREMKR